jgi:hypothetical protein
MLLAEERWKEWAAMHGKYSQVKDARCRWRSYKEIYGRARLKTIEKVLITMNCRGSLYASQTRITRKCKYLNKMMIN